MRFSTWNVPRLIRSYRETLDCLLLPRGLRERAETIVAEAGSQLLVGEAWSPTDPQPFALLTTLTTEQQHAFEDLIGHDLGVLVAPPGSGKTVIGCAVMAHHRQPTLIIVDREPLVEQWRDRLVTHLGLQPRQIGQMGGGRKRTTGIVDIAMVQSLARREDLAEAGRSYGLAIVDECHHVPAVTFERAVRELPVRRWLGLTATPYRRDGLQALMAMHCGPIRHRMTSSANAGVLRRLDLVVHETAHPRLGQESQIHEEFRWVVEDEGRNGRICSDVATAALARRNCLVLTRWTEHLRLLVEGMRDRGLEPLALHGGIGKTERSKVLGRLEDGASSGGIVLVATASFLGEGFDCPYLDTLFLTFPIRFKGSVVQYVGRVLRHTETKTQVEVHDYLDVQVPVLARMYDERVRAYASLGFTPPPRPHSSQI